jgi:hypothetical protein
MKFTQSMRERFKSMSNRAKNTIGYGKDAMASWRSSFSPNHGQKPESDELKQEVKEHRNTGREVHLPPL